MPGCRSASWFELNRLDAADHKKEGKPPRSRGIARIWFGCYPFLENKAHFFKRLDLDGIDIAFRDHFKSNITRIKPQLNNELTKTNLTLRSRASISAKKLKTIINLANQQSSIQHLLANKL